MKKVSFSDENVSNQRKHRDAQYLPPEALENTNNNPLLFTNSNRSQHQKAAIKKIINRAENNYQRAKTRKQVCISQPKNKL